jgi:membrane-associated phospholipid phosphatase
MPGGAHLLPALDQAVHAAVVAGTTPEWRATTADIDISDAAITAGMAGWAVTSAYLLAAAPKRHALPLTLAWAFYLWGFGAVLTDPALVHSLKAAFHRLRPSTLHHSFSFPSGHTTAASFIVGALVMVLLPLALQQAAQQQEAQQQAAQQQAAQQQAAQQQPPQAPGGAQVGGVGGAASALARRCLPGWYGAAGGMWAAGVVATASGRVLADAHWVSDTLAGACLGAAGVAALSWLVSLATEPVLQERTAPTPAAEEAELKL